MTDEPTSAEVAIDEALAEAAAELPPPMNASPPPSLLHLIFGNAVLVLFVIVVATRSLPWWLIAAVCFFTVIVLALKDPRAKVRAQYSAVRLAEVKNAFPTEAAARLYVEKEAVTAAETEGIGAIWWPALVLTLVVPLTIFLNVGSSLADWHWLLRWPAAFIAAAAGWGIAALLWGSANFVPGLFPPGALDPPPAHSDELGREDENDIQIIRQQVHLDSLNKRIETYTLEGALLSALSFSSFVSLIVSERDYLDQLASLFDSSLQWRQIHLGGVIATDTPVPDYPDLWEFTSGHLIPLIGLSMLFCAATFLGVLVARLRFNEGYRDADSCLKIAEKFNAKEEQAVQANDSVKAHFYAAAIARLLMSAREWERGLAIIVMQMRVSRNMGIIFFIFTLVLCGFFFEPTVAGIIAMLFAALGLVGYADRFARQLISRKILSQAVLGPLTKAFRRDRD